MVPHGRSTTGGGTSMNDDRPAESRSRGVPRLQRPRRRPHRRPAGLLPQRRRTRSAGAGRRALGEAPRRRPLPRAADARDLRRAGGQRLAHRGLRACLAGARSALRQAHLRLLRRARDRRRRWPRSGARSSWSRAPRPTSASCSRCSRCVERGHVVFLLEDCVASSEPHTRPALERMYAAGVVPCTLKTAYYELMQRRDRLPRPPFGGTAAGSCSWRVRRAREPPMAPATWRPATVE